MELAKRIAEDLDAQVSVRDKECSDFPPDDGQVAAIIASHVAPLEAALAASQADCERLAAVSLAAADKYQTLQADNAALRKQVEELRNMACRQHEIDRLKGLIFSLAPHMREATSDDNQRVGESYEEYRARVFPEDGSKPWPISAEDMIRMARTFIDIHRARCDNEWEEYVKQHPEAAEKVAALKKSQVQSSAQ